MRWAQGGKFEHGFLSGFVSSLGGSYLHANGANMTGAEKIALSAAIGGTAEALGGGKFANGAVTGAYVMAWNHMMHEVGDSKPIPDGKSAIQVYSLQELVSDIDRYSTATGVEVGGIMLVMGDGTSQYWILPWDKNNATTCIFDPERIPNIAKAVVGENYRFHSHLSENGPSFPDFFENSSNAHWTPNMYKRDFVIGKSAIFEVNRFNGVMAPRGVETGRYLVPKSEWLNGNFIGL